MRRILVSRLATLHRQLEDQELRKHLEMKLTELRLLFSAFGMKTILSNEPKACGRSTIRVPEG